MKFSRLCRLFFPSACLLVALWACETSEISPVQIATGAEYYPIEVGNYWVYQVDTVNYTFTGDTLSGTFFRKEKISDTLPDSEGSKVFRLEIYKRTAETQPWVIDSVWTVRKDSRRIVKTENNKPFVKLTFPLQNGSSWDGNLFNPDRDSNTVFWYKIRNLGQKTPFGNLEVESVEIVQKIDSSCLEKNYFTEVYYRNIGLGLRNKTDLDYVSCEGNAEIKQGKIYQYRLLSYGKE